MNLARTALRLLPFQVVLRGGEALLPLFLAAWFGRSPETDLYYLFATYFVFAGAVLTGAFQDSAVVPVLVEAEATEPASVPESVEVPVPVLAMVTVPVALPPPLTANSIFDRIVEDAPPPVATGKPATELPNERE